MPSGVRDTNHTSAKVASRQIADRLRTQILGGVYKPGDRIRQEALAEQSESSRLPVREALRILQSEGLVTLVSNKGAWVTELDLQECIELYKIRERLEPLLMEESAPLLTGEDIERLAELVQQMEETIKVDIDAFLELDRTFHLATYRGSRTPRLYAMVETLWNTTQHYRRAYAGTLSAEQISLLYFEHRLLVDALAARDTNEAATIVQSHIHRTRVALSRVPHIFQPSSERPLDA